MSFKNKRRDASWDFREADTKRHTHCFHSYPAMMIPQVAGRILEIYGNETKMIFDPYCGTGTSLVEANLRGINAIGTDINPLARLMAKTKTTVIPIDILDASIKDYTDSTMELRFDNNMSDRIPNVSNMDFWFGRKAQLQLASIKGFIDNIGDECVSNFFKVAFSETVRACSLAKRGEFKLVRMPPEQRESFDPDAYIIMRGKLLRNRAGLIEFMADLKVGASSKVHSFNTIDGIPADILPPSSVQMVLTSPPYGDSRTTVAYGQFSRLSNEWLGIENANQIDKECMGGRLLPETIMFDFEPLDSALRRIENKNEKRAREVSSFYHDYKLSIDSVAGVVEAGGHVAYVVGNRRVAGLELPTDEITREFFERNDFEHIETIVRGIPRKRMPSKNSPTNVTGAKGSTMKKEYIVILRKL